MAILTIIGIIGSFIVVYAVLRLLASLNGSRKRQFTITKRLQPIIDKLQANQQIALEEVEDIAKSPEMRIDLYQLLRYHDRSDLFPHKYINKKSMGEAALAYWLLHPNELGKVPKNIEFVTSVEQKVNDKSLEYFVYKFIDDNDKQWKVGVAGPFYEQQGDYGGYPGTFSSFEAFDSQSPEDHVKWVHNMMMSKKMYEALINE